MRINWKAKKLDDACNVAYGTRVVNKRDGGSVFPVYGGGGATFFMDEYNRENCMVVARFAMSEKCTRFISGKFFLNDSGLTVLPKSKKKITQEFIDYQLILLNDLIYSLARGSAQKNLDLPAFRKVEIFYPESLSEQKRIIKILDEVFDKIEIARKNTEKNLQNVKELFESYLQGVFLKSINKCEGVRFGEIMELLTDYHANGSYKILKENVELKKTEDYAWMVRSTDFENNFKKDKRYITKKSYNFLKKSKIFGKEIIICKIGNAGKVYLMPKIDRPCSLAMNSFLVRLNEQKCLSEYVYRFLNSQNGREQIESRILGTTTKTITKNNVRSIEIPLLSLKEQKQIVKKLDKLSEQTKKLEKNYQQKINDLDELKKSVLKKAFSGEL